MSSVNETKHSLQAQIDELKSKLAEKETEDSRFELLVESAPNGIIVSNEAGEIILVNQMAEKLFGYGREEFLRLKIEDLVPQKVRQSHRKHRETYHANSEIRQMGAGRDLNAIRKDGSEFPVEIGLTPLPAKEGRTVLSTIVDITERKRVEEKLLIYANELERSNSELENFASVASHDLQEPLRKIRTIGERLAKIAEQELGEKSLDYLERMINASERMHQLILDLLAFSRVSQSEPFEETDLNAPVSDVLSDLEIAIEESGGSVDVGDLPTAEVDVRQIRQVFQNLIGNALKFAKPEEPIMVEVTGCELEDNQVEVTIKDNGIGFDQQYSVRIFTIFQRLHGRSQYEGTGVGLAICKKIIDRHGGTITATSQLGKGAEFRIILPRRQKES